jgi:hypothetical protein
MIGAYKYAAIATGAVAAVLAIFFFGYHQGGLSATTKAQAASIIQLKALGDAWSARELAIQTKETAYEKEKTGLQIERTAVPNMVVRLCVATPRANLPATAESGHDVPAATGLGAGDASEVPSGPGQDYGPELFGLADRLDSVAAKCRSM